MKYAYADLEIRISAVQEKGFPVQLSFAGGAEFELGYLDPADLPWIPTVAPTDDGERLFEWLCRDNRVRNAWYEARGHQGQRRIRLRIDADNPELHTIPWELLRERGQGGLGHDLAAAPSTPLSRYLENSNPLVPPRLDGPVRVLVAIADPKKLPGFGLDPIKADKEWALLQEATKGVDSVALTRLPDACTLPALIDALNDGYHVLHFVGHGGFNKETGTVLFLAKDEDNVEVSPEAGQDLADQFYNHLVDIDPAQTDRLSLIYLSSCETAKGNTADAFRGLAPKLVLAGLPAVVAMQEPIAVETARAFAGTFYRQMFRHGLVDRAANEARAAVIARRLPGASIPVLYMRVEDGRLFDIEPAPEGDEKAAVSPYKGLAYFDQKDTSVFFGREAQTAELVDYLHGHRFLAVIGASGSGKSSLVRAGLVPALKRGEVVGSDVSAPEGSTEWPIHVITPGAMPLKSLAISLTSDVDGFDETLTLNDALAANTGSLDLYVRKLLDRDETANRLLLVVDQFEELFTLCKRAEQRRAFIDNLLTAAADDGVTTVIITLRADFYHRCADFEALRAAVAKHQNYIGPMTEAQLRSAIEEPARAGGWQLDPGLTDLLLQDVADEPGNLPLLSHALLEIWNQRSGRALTFAGYLESGRVQGAIARTADSVLADRLKTETQQAIARDIFLKLTELGEGAPDTRRRATRDEILRDQQEAEVETILATLVEARLIIVDSDEVEVAHEALIREWPTLRRWLTEGRVALRLERKLREDVQEWVEANRDAGLLYRGPRFERVREWAENPPPTWKQPVKEFLEQSADLYKLDVGQRRLDEARNLKLAGEADRAISLFGEVHKHTPSLIDDLEAEIEDVRREVATALVRKGEVYASFARARFIQDEAESKQRESELEGAEVERADAEAMKALTRARDAEAEYAIARATAEAAESEDDAQQAREEAEQLLAAVQKAQSEMEAAQVAPETRIRARELRAAAGQAAAEAAQAQVNADSLSHVHAIVVEPDLPWTDAWQCADGFFRKALALRPPPDTPIYVWIPAGEFSMGSDGTDLDAQPDEMPAHDVYVDGFWISRVLLTNEQYARYVRSQEMAVELEPDNNRWNRPGFGMHPVTNVDWEQANGYAQWVGGLLPTEAEWEKACRGGFEIPNDPTKAWGEMIENPEPFRIYPWGNDAPSQDQANFGRSGIDTWTDVGSYPDGASPYGCLEMVGNVYEWVADWYHEAYYSESPYENPYGPVEGGRYRADDVKDFGRASSTGSYEVTEVGRVLRGGSYEADEVKIRCTYRDKVTPFAQYGNVGFRVVIPAYFAADEV